VLYRVIANSNFGGTKSVWHGPQAQIVKTIYHLRDDRERIAKVQAASLSPKPIGLKPIHGLFGSDEWWRNLDASVIPVIRYAGTITRLFLAGMHNESECFEIVTDGQAFRYDCKALRRRDRKLYKVGVYVELAFVQQELKRPVLTTTGDVNDTHSRCLVEIRITEGLAESRRSS
jgi:hypothetical protein